jgi:hypothetical protein
MAKYDGTGTALLQAAFGNVGINGTVAPTCVAVGPGGNIVVAGTFTLSLPFSNLPPLTSAGSNDAFTVALSPALAPIWSSRLGAPGTAADMATAVAITSTGSVLVAGTFSGATTGAASLPYTYGNGTDAFLLQYSSTGAAQFSAAFGGPGLQSVGGVVANRKGTGAALDAIVFGGPYDTGIVFPPLAALPVTAGASFLVWAPLGP